MRSVVLIISTLLLYFSSNAQSLQAEVLTGEWKVQSSELTEELNLDQNQARKLDMLTKGFVGSTFIFHADGFFQLYYPQKAPDFMQLLSTPRTAQWKITKEKSLVTIGTKEDQYSIMGIIVKNLANKTYFLLVDTPLVLEVSKK